MKFTEFLKQSKLKDNPFSITPSKLVWAGRKEIYKNIKTIIDRDKATTPFSIVLIAGGYGAGKTFAAKYFSQKNIIDPEGKNTALSLYIRLPKTRRDIIKQLYINILNGLRFEVIKKSIKIFFKQRDAKEKIYEFSNIEDIAKIFKKLIDGDDAIAEKAKNALYLSATTAMKHDLGISQKFDTEDEIYGLLSAVINVVMIANSYSRIFIWIDEIEVIDELGAAAALSFRTFLRTLSDLTPTKVSIFLSFTYAPGETVDAIWRIIGTAVRSRIGKNIIDIEPMNEAEIIEYITVLLKERDFRTEKYNPETDEFLPFENENVIKYLANKLKRVEPRKVNETITLIFQLTSLEDKTNISSEFIENYLKEPESTSEEVTEDKTDS